VVKFYLNCSDYRVILFVTFGSLDIEQLKVSEEEVRNVMPCWSPCYHWWSHWAALLKQYASYKNKKIKYQKNVTETLFSKNLASNTGAFHSYWCRWEEECKEIILVYYHLLTSKVLSLLNNWITDRSWCRKSLALKLILISTSPS